MRVVIGALAATTLAALGGLHAFWAARRASPSLRFVVPEVNGAPAFRPTRAQTIAVAGALFTGAALVAGALTLPAGALLFLSRVGCGGMGVVLTARAIGDFRLVGIFKRRRGTAFAWWDDRAFTPLCAALALASFAVALGLPTAIDPATARQAGTSERRTQRGPARDARRPWRRSPR